MVGVVAAAEVQRLAVDIGMAEQEEAAAAERCTLAVVLESPAALLVGQGVEEVSST